MKLMAIIVLIGAYILGAYDQDMTAAVVLTILFAPEIFDSKKVRKCTTRSVHTAERH